MKTGLLVLALMVGLGVGHAADNVLSRQEEADGWTLLFDGRSLDEWMNPDGSPSRRPIEQGSINAYKAGGYMLLHKKQWENFILKADYKMAPGCNSGIFVRTTPLTPQPGKTLGHNGIEFQIHDSAGAGYHDTGAIYDLVKPTRQMQRPVGEWNHVVMTVDCNIVAVELNEVEVARLDLDQFDKPFLRPDGTKHKFSSAWKDHPRVGYIGLQDHGADIWFKNIKLKPLD